MEKKKILKLQELKDLATQKIEELRRSEDFAQSLSDKPVFSDVKAYIKTTFEDFEEKSYLVCDCGCIQEKSYFFYDSKCPKCGGLTRKDIKAVRLFNFDGQAKMIAVSSVIKNKKEDNSIINEYQSYVIAWSGNNIITNYRRDNLSNSLLSIYDTIGSLKELMTRVEFNQVYLEDEEKTKEALTEIQRICDEKAKKRTAPKAKTKRQQIQEEFLEKVEEVYDKKPEKYSFTAVKSRGVAVNFSEKGKYEFNFDESLIDGGIYSDTPMCWRGSVTLTDVKTGKTYDTNLRDSDDKNLKLYINQFGDICGIIYYQSVALDESCQDVTVGNCVTKGFYFDENTCNIVDKDGKTNNRSGWNWNDMVVNVDKEELFKLLEESNQNDYSTKYAFESAFNGDLLNVREVIETASVIKDFPVVESLKKTGFTALADEITKDKSDFEFLKSTKSIYDIIGFKNKEFTREVAKLNPRYSTLKTLSEIFTIDGKKSKVSDIIWFADNHLISRNNALTNCLKIIGSASRLKEYLINVLNYQCIGLSESMMILSDYYNMANKVHYDMRNKNILFPSSLKKEHDIVLFSYNAIKEELDLQEFEESVKSYRNLEYAQTAKSGLMAIAPEKPADIIGEGKSLHHCVASYVSSVKDRRTRIMFVRRKENPTESFYTVEVNLNDTIIQVRGLQNCAPTKEVKDFIKEWSEKKKLLIHY